MAEENDRILKFPGVPPDNTSFKGSEDQETEAVALGKIIEDLANNLQMAAGVWHDEQEMFQNSYQNIFRWLECCRVEAIKTSATWEKDQIERGFQLFLMLHKIGVLSSCLMAKGYTLRIIPPGEKEDGRTSSEQTSRNGNGKGSPEKD